MAFLLGLWFAVSACSGKAPIISVEDVKAVETQLFVPTISVFMTIHNKGASRDVLVAARLDDFPWAKVEIHDVIDGRMTRIDKMEIPAGKSVQLTPGGPHLMAFKVNEPIKELTLVLEFKRIGALTIKTPISSRPS